MRRSTEIVLKTLVRGLADLAEDSPDPILGTVGDLARVMRNAREVEQPSAADMFGLDSFEEPGAATEAPSGICARCRETVLRSWHFCPACGGDTFIERVDHGGMSGSGNG